MRKYADLLRIRQWVKNAFIFVAAFFGAEFNFENLFELSIAFVVFSIVASAVYIFNDIRDSVNDRMHPTKRFRPIAAGTVTVSTAIVIAVFLMVVALLGTWLFLNTGFLLVILIYFLLNFLYYLGLKKLSIVDLLIVSFGFLLLVIGGSEVVSVEVSFRLLLMTFLFSMFIVIGKRRDDFKSGSEEVARLRGRESQLQRILPQYWIDYIFFPHDCMLYHVHLFFPKINSQFVAPPEAIEKLNWHRARGHEVAVVSASISNYLTPYFQQKDVIVIATVLEVKQDRLTGKFSTPNCYGSEKCNRITGRFNMDEYSEIYVYGDSAGDKEMLEMGTKQFFRKFR